MINRTTLKVAIFTYLLLFLPEPSQAASSLSIDNCIKLDAKRFPENISSYERMRVFANNICNIKLFVRVCIKKMDGSWYSYPMPLEAGQRDWAETYHPSKSGEYNAVWHTRKTPYTSDCTG